MDINELETVLSEFVKPEIRAEFIEQYPEEAKSLDPEELLDELINYGGSESVGWEFWYEQAETKNSLPVRVENVGAVKTSIALYMEDADRDDVHMVFSISTGDAVETYVKVGFYTSYYGSSWDGKFYKAVPKSVTVTTFEEIE